MVVLRKMGKKNYRIPKAYRPIALLNTIGKALESVIARRISYMVETHNILPPTYLGGRKGISTEHAVLHLVDWIRRAWGHGRHVVTMVLVDVSGAYDNVSHQRLLHNLRMQGLGFLVPWISSFLTGRLIRICMPEHMTESFSTPTGIPQGSPMSPILYLLYNCPLIKECSSHV